MAIKNILQKVDLNKLKSLSGTDDQQVALSLAAKYERIIFTNTPQKALGYINKTYSMVKNELVQLHKTEKTGEQKRISQTVIDLLP